MKTKQLSTVARTLSAVIVSVLVLGSCQFGILQGGKDAKGSVTISAAQGDSSTRTLRPAGALVAISTYCFHLVGPGNVTQDLSSGTSTTTPSNLAVGSWTVTVSAKSATSVELLSGSTTFTVTAGQTTNASVALSPATGKGSVLLTVSIPSFVTGVTGTLTPSGGSAGTILASKLAITGTTLTYTETILDAGTYFLALTLTNAQSAVVGMILEDLDVFANIQTNPSLNLAASDLNKVPVAPAAPVAAASGGGSVTLSLTSVLGATGYNVYYKANSSTATTSDTKALGSPFTILSPVVSGLVAGTSYAFMVTAVNTVGEGPASTAATAIPTAPSPTMVSVAGGTFNNGSSDVTVSSFKMSTTEVTQAQYLAVTGSNPSSFTGDLTRPVEMVTWYDAMEFCNKLSVLEGKTAVYTISGRTPATGYPITSATVTMDITKNGYRLPTEAEWEFAARGGAQTSNTIYAGSSTIDAVAWYSINSGGTTHTVGTKTANELGLSDMSGNAWEWCWDWYGVYPSGAQTDPLGITSSSNRVLRGGSAGADDATRCTVSIRGLAVPSDQGDRSYIFGFRIVTSLPRTPQGLTATAGSGQVSLSWTAVTGATAYNVYYAAGSTATTASTKASSAMISGTTAAITGLASGTQYAFVVTAVNVADESATSAVATATPAAATGVPRNGLVSEYLFNGNANDTADSNNGTPIGASLVANRFGNTNSAYQFSGGTSSYIQLANASNLDFPCSVSVWINYSSIASYWSCIYESDCWNNYAGGYTGYYGVVLGLNPTIYVWSGYGSSGNSPYAVSYWNSFVPAPNTWVHAVFVMTDRNTVSTYMNGSLVATTLSDTNGVAMTHSGTPGRIGQSSDSAGRTPFIGTIDDLRVYNRALSTAEVQGLYSEGGWIAYPAAPASLNATPGQSSVNLSWPTVSGATSYNVYYAAGSSATTTSVG